MLIWFVYYEISIITILTAKLFFDLLLQLIASVNEEFYITPSCDIYIKGGTWFKCIFIFILCKYYYDKKDNNNSNGFLKKIINDDGQMTVP